MQSVLKKYSLPGVVGNSALKSTVSRMSFAAPVIIEGDAGSGKMTAAMDIAAGLLCGSQGDAPCYTCPACQRVKAGSHPDLHILTYEGKEKKLDEVRSFRERVFIKPSEGDINVFIIERGDKLSVAAQNALLKTLEDSPSAVFLITAEYSSGLLPTILSRCITLWMQPLTEAEMQKALMERGYEYSEEAYTAGNGFLGQVMDYLSNDEPAYRQLARDFAKAIDEDELAIFAQAMKAGKLKREEYAHFSGALCDELVIKTKKTPRKRYFDIYDYIINQTMYFGSNPSVTAMSGALASKCGAGLT